MTFNESTYLRKALLTIELKTQIKVIDELRIKFEIVKDISAYANTAYIQVYNLSQDSRGFIKQEGQRVRLSAGYGDRIGQLFDGTITNIFHRRDKADFITEFYAQDGIQDQTNTVVNVADKTYRTLYETLIYLVKFFTDGETNQPPSIGEINLTNPNEPVGEYHYSGYLSDSLNALARTYGFNWFFLDGKFYAVSESLTLTKSTITTIAPDSGLIGVPEITELGVNARCILNATLQPTSLVRIRSTSQRVQFGNRFLDNINRSVGEGTYDIRELRHVGDTRGNDWYTDFEAGRFTRTAQNTTKAATA